MNTLTTAEIARFEELEERNSKHDLTSEEVNELQELLDRYYGWTK